MMACGAATDVLRMVVRMVLGGGMLLALIAGWIVLLVTLWRGMRAHETLAAAVKKLADQDHRARE